MKPTTLMGLVMIAAAVTAMWRPDAPPVETTVEAPDATVQAVVAPVSAKLAERSGEAWQLAAFYAAAAEAIRRDGQGDRIVRTTGELRTFLERTATIRFQGAFRQVPGLADAIHGPKGALAQLLDLEATDLDHDRAAAALDAVAWACGEAA